MINKIIGLITILLALLGIFISIGLFKETPDLGWSLLAGSLFTILIGVVIFRRGLRGVAESVSKSKIF
ncbi:MAG: hypothetical protein WCJ36_03165 [Candidatus Saccharibacteria bacterium]